MHHDVLAWRMGSNYSKCILLYSSPGHLAGNSDSTSIHYYEIRELKKNFKFFSGNPNYFPEVSFK